MNTGENASTHIGNRFHRYLQYAAAILSNYKIAGPFHLYLKKYFSANKKHGSKDRKKIASLCYHYLRLGFGVSSQLDVEDSLLLATFLLEHKSSALLDSLKPEWNEKIHLSLSEKLELVKNVFNANGIFPFEDELSAEINYAQFNNSFLIRPKLYLRIRPGYFEKVIDKLNAANISFEKINGDCLAFSNNEKVSDVISIDKEAVVQDYNSQRVRDFFKSQITGRQSKTAIWDCCAASGGKSILAYDVFKNIELTVSDTRKNILENLKIRFSKSGIKNYHSFVADLSGSFAINIFEKGAAFDFIIADVPCTGSGTWARTPEQLKYFSKKSIGKYSILQQMIVAGAVQYLKYDGYFLYITCSVFKKENEENVEFIQKKLNIELIESRYLKGYEMQADTLFAALFKKNIV